MNRAIALPDAACLRRVPAEKILPSEPGKKVPSEVGKKLPSEVGKKLPSEPEKKVLDICKNDSCPQKGAVDKVIIIRWLCSIFKCTKMGLYGTI